MNTGISQDEVSVERRKVLQQEVADFERERIRLEQEWRDARYKAEEERGVRESLEKARWELEEAQRYDLSSSPFKRMASVPLTHSPFNNTREGNFQKASELRYSIIPDLVKKLPAEHGEEEDGPGERVTSDDIARVVARVGLNPPSFVLPRFPELNPARPLDDWHSSFDACSWGSNSPAGSRDYPPSPSDRSRGRDQICCRSRSSLTCRTTKCQSPYCFILILRLEWYRKDRACKGHRRGAYGNGEEYGCDQHEVSKYLAS